MCIKTPTDLSGMRSDEYRLSRETPRSSMGIQGSYPNRMFTSSFSYTYAGMRGMVPSRAFSTFRRRVSVTTCCQATTMPGKVRNIPATEFTKLVNDGWIVLDVRPAEELNKAPLQNAVEIPLFIADESASISTLIKKSTAFGMGGWWLGGTHMIPNPDFLASVQASIPDKETAKIIVVCQKGLRSLSACEQLARVGYKNLAWINGGLDTGTSGTIPTKNGVDVRVGGIGGLSEFLGWTEVQQENGSGFAGGYQNILKFFAVILALDLVWFLYTLVTSDFSSDVHPL